MAAIWKNQFNECLLYFALTGNGFDPDKISTAINLKATKSCVKAAAFPEKYRYAQAGNTAHPF